jgi:hypothetical protein
LLVEFGFNPWFALPGASDKRSVCLFEHVGDGLILALQGLGIAKFADDRLGSASFPRHEPVLLPSENTDLNGGAVFSGQVRW